MSTPNSKPVVCYVLVYIHGYSEIPCQQKIEAADLPMIKTALSNFRAYMKDLLNYKNQARTQGFEQDMHKLVAEHFSDLAKFQESKYEL